MAERFRPLRSSSTVIVIWACKGEAEVDMRLHFAGIEDVRFKNTVYREGGTSVSQISRTMKLGLTFPPSTQGYSNTASKGTHQR